MHLLNRRLGIVVALLMGMSTAALHAQDKEKEKPLVRIEADGPLSYVTSLAFRQDTEEKKLVLHAAGWDKTVHAWSVGNTPQPWTYDKGQSVRVPIAPGVYGSANAMAISSDGAWLAVAGRGVVRGLAGWHDNGVLAHASSMTKGMLLDLGTILVFHLPTGKVHRMRGHAGTVVGLTFVPGGPPVLVSAAIELPAGTGGKVRVWDVTESREMKTLHGMPDRILRPGLSAWRVGPVLEQIRVAVAWGDDKLRVWDAGANQLSVAPSDTRPIAVWSLPGQPARLLAGAGSKLGVWTVPDAAGGGLGQMTRAANFNPLVSLSPSAGPLAVTAVPPNGPQPDLTAWVVLESKTFDYRLMLARLPGGAIAADIPLWRGATKPPVIAADPSGRYLAISGNENNEIWMYRVQDLLAGGMAKQVLRSVAQTMRFASFAQRDQQLGVVVGTAPAGSPPRAWQPASDQVFDLKQRRVSNVQGWQDFNADQAGWSVVPAVANERLQLEVGRQGQPPKTIVLDKGDVLTSWSVCPPTALSKDPLLVVGLLHDSEAQLLLYSAASGELLRQLSGHFDRIDSLRFSRDGKLLASAAMDNTVSVWWLADLAESLQANGALRELAVEPNEQGQLVVKQDRPGRFTTGDVLSIIHKDPDKPPRAVKFRSAWEFQNYVAERKPGDKLTIEVTRANDQGKATVETLVERAIPERKPLCSLFFFAERRNEGLKWIGWDPLGRYDASGDEAERRLGWHFNTDDPDFPVKFAVAEKYREQNYWEGLLGDHVEKGPVLVPKPPPAPEMSLFLREGEDLLKAVAGGPFVARTRAPTALVRLVGDFPERSIDSVTWQIGEAKGVFQRVSAGLYEADLEGAGLGRTAAMLHAEVLTREQPPRAFFREALLRVVPPPARIDVAPAMPETAKVEKLAFAVSIQSDVFSKAETVAVKLVHTHEGKEAAAQEWEAADATASERQLVLRPGSNLITITARPAKALPDTIELEEAKRSWIVRLTAAQRPEIQLLGVVRSGEPEPVPLVPDAPFVTGEPRLDFRGKISVAAPDVLTRAFYTVAGNEKEIDLAGFKPDKGSTFEFTQALPLVPGLQTVTLTTMTNRRISDRVSFSAQFKPVLPAIEKVTLTQAGQPLPQDNLFVEGRHEPKVTAEIQLAPPPKELMFPHDVDVLLRLRSGEAVAEEALAVKVQDLPQTIRHELVLKPGENEFNVVLKNRWGNEVSAPGTVMVLRQPPKIVKVNLPAETKTPEVLLAAEVATATPLLRVAVFTNGLEVPAEGVKMAPVPDAKDRWQVVAKVPMQVASKKTDIEMSVWNRDGETLEPYQGSSNYVLPPPPVPEIRLENPVQTRTGQLDVRFRVRSTTPLQRVTARISRRGLTLQEEQLPLDAAGAPDASGFVAYRQAWSLDEIGERTFQVIVEASNKGGVGRTAPIDVNYLPEPPQLVVDELRPVGGAKALAHKGFKTQRFESAANGRLQLKGHLDTTRGVDRSSRVKVWVNGFLQMSLPVDAQSKFSGEINLNVAKSNRISFELPHLPVEDERLPTLVLDCTAHLPPPKMHLLTVVATSGAFGTPVTASASSGRGDGNGGVAAKVVADNSDARSVREQIKTPRELQQKIVDALSRRRGQPQEKFELVGYPPRGPTPGVLSGDFTAQDFIGVLAYVRRVMQPRISQPANDVLVVYYAGTEVMDGSTDFQLRTGNPRSMITRKWLSGFLGEMPGAHLLLLDVEQQGPRSAVAMWKRDPRLGLLRVVSSPPTALASAKRRRFLLCSTLEEVMRVSEAPEVSLKVADAALQNEFEKLRETGVLFNSDIPEDLEELVLKR